MKIVRRRRREPGNDGMDKERWKIENEKAEYEEDEKIDGGE